MRRQRTRMYIDADSIQISVLQVLLLFGLILLITCSKKEAPSDPARVAKEAPSTPARVAKEMPSTPARTADVPPSSQDDPPPPSHNMRLPLNVERQIGDLDEMVKRGAIRALVVLNPIGFFYDSGLPRGVMYEALREFQSFINEKLKTGAKKVEVTFLPVRIDQLEVALTEGLGDIIAYAVTVTPDRERRVAFSTPIQKDVTQIIVTGPPNGAISTLEELSGREVYVNPLTVFYENLQKVNDSLRMSGKAPIVIKAADKNLGEDDLIQMVNAAMIPATVTTQMRANLWSRVLDNIEPHPELVIAGGVELAWVMRKNNPRLKQVVDEFVGSRAAGTSFGNTLIRRYLKDTEWVKNSTSKEEIEKFRALVAIFRKYAVQYDFDYLMLAAQGYQESGLNQAMKSPGGAVGIMQVIPKDAAASPINIPNVSNAASNIHAGAKMLRNIADTYFNDPKVDAFNRALFALASYNAGPNRIAGLREQAKEQGLDPNVWFNNVELIAAKDIGQVTVMYVRNIYKYYVAYKLALEQSKLQ
jgi:membrane-bound lytic murein transglycosylase MltF